MYLYNLFHQFFDEFILPCTYWREGDFGNTKYHKRQLQQTFACWSSAVLSRNNHYQWWKDKQHKGYQTKQRKNIEIVAIFLS